MHCEKLVESEAFFQNQYCSIEYLAPPTLCSVMYSTVLCSLQYWGVISLRSHWHRGAMTKRHLWFRWRWLFAIMWSSHLVYDHGFLGLSCSIVYYWDTESYSLSPNRNVTYIKNLNTQILPKQFTRFSVQTSREFSFSPPPLQPQHRLITQTIMFCKKFYYRRSGNMGFSAIE